MNANEQHMYTTVITTDTKTYCDPGIQKDT